MKTKIVRTENVNRLVAALAELVRRGPGVPGLALVHGHQGYGKTVATEWWAVQQGAVYLRAQAAWTVPWLLMDLAASLGLAPEHISRNNFRLVTRELRQRPRPVLLDEADYLVRDRRLLDTVRDLYDTAGAPIVLVGMAGVREAVARRSPQFWSRVSREVEFSPLGVEDTRLIALELCGLELPAEAARRLVRETEGIFRKTVVLLHGIETRMKANPGKEPGEVMDLAVRGMRAAG
jgi:DNA transposition AAA+ family ATPase